MAVVKKKSSKELLEELKDRKEKGGITAESIHHFQSVIEKNMESFDMEKKQKTAKAIEDLSKLVITA